MEFDIQLSYGECELFWLGKQRVEIHFSERASQGSCGDEGEPEVEYGWGINACLVEEAGGSPEARRKKLLQAEISRDEWPVPA